MGLLVARELELLVGRAHLRNIVNDDTNHHEVSHRPVGDSQIRDEFENINTKARPAWSRR